MGWLFSGVRKRVVSKRVVLADVPGPQKLKSRNEGTKTSVPGPTNRNKGTKNGTTVKKNGKRAHLPKPPFFKTALFLSSRS